MGWRFAWMQDLADLDEEFKEVHLPILERFYLLFEGIYKYVKDFVRYLEDLEAGVFIQHTFEVRPCLLLLLLRLDGCICCCVCVRVESGWLSFVWREKESGRWLIVLRRCVCDSHRVCC